MAARPQLAIAAARQQHRQVFVAVAVAVAQAAEVDDHRAVEQRAIRFPGRLEFFQEVSEDLRVQAVDLGDLLDPFGVAAVVRERVVRVGDVDLRVDAHAALAPDHQR